MHCIAFHVASQVSLHPLVIHLTYNLALALQDYFQLTRDDGAGGDDASVLGTPGDAKQPSGLEPGDRSQHGGTGGPAGAAATAAEKMAAKLGRRRDEVRRGWEGPMFASVSSIQDEGVKEKRRD